jgi:xanthine dehydrogenase accessory factor
MREIIQDILRWDEPTAIATVVETWGSAPRQVGAKLAMTPGHKMSGSVSGGCIEGAVFEEALGVLNGGGGRLLRYGVADETAFEVVGLACGGSVEVFVEALTPQVRDFWRAAVQHDSAAVTATVIDGPAALVGFKLLLAEDGALQTSAGDERFNALLPHLLDAARAGLRDGRTRHVNLHVNGETLRAFVDVALPAPQLIIVGGVHIALTLSELARAMGYRVIVVDPRAAFGNAERFPNADRLLAVHPKEALAHVAVTRSTAIVTLTHDNRFDDPAIVEALQSNAFYVGALGGKTTREKRRERLLKRGLSEAQLDRLAAPIGLDLGAQTPEEIALATMAQIVAVRNGKTIGG